MRSSSTSSSQRTTPTSGRDLSHSETILVSINRSRLTNRPRTLPPRTRSISRSDPRSGEAAKNSARVPLRPVLRTHSSDRDDDHYRTAISGDFLWPFLARPIDDLTQPSLGLRYRPSRSLGHVCLAYTSRV